ncbi:MAG: site-2 protease family protein [Candidatus Omnitrophota bacterium]|nr:site-2 protease family protein [Candidatus Omnitrophota bacterium]
MIFIAIIILFISIVLHEYAHGWMAYKLGDPTPKEAGRLTLNPFAHIDIFGTIILPIIFFKVTAGRFSFGYAKPVPINPYHFKNPKKDVMWVGLAGPATNFIISIFLLIVFKLLPNTLLSEVFLEGAVINIILALFNLIPIPPLDGSRVISALLPYRLSYAYLKMGLVGSFVIIFLISMGFSNWFIMPLVAKILSFWGIRVIL